MKTYNYNFYTKIRSWFDRSSPLYATRLALLISVFLSFAGIYLGTSLDSLAVQTNGLISAVDILYSFIFITAVRQSMKSPDYAFNYGYGKYESLFLLGAGGVLSGILSFTLYDTIVHFGDSTKYVGNRNILIAFSMLSAIIMLTMHRIQKKAAKVHKIPSLEYDAALWKVDTIVEFGVILNLIIGYAFDEFGLRNVAKYIDSTTAIILVSYALIIPLKGARTAFNQLLDRTVDEEIQFNLLSVVAENINRFCEFKAMHTRQSGKDLFIELDVIMPFDYSIEQKYELEKTIQKSIKEKYPNSIPRLYVIPCNRECIKDGRCTCPVRGKGEIN